jgi:hypothetical protein
MRHPFYPVWAGRCSEDGGRVTTLEAVSSFGEALFANPPSSLICKVGEQTVESCADEECHSGLPMRSEGYFDPTKSGAELE